MRVAVFATLALALCGLAVWSQLGEPAEARALREFERLAPAARAPACAPESPYAKAFAGALARDTRPSAAVGNDKARRAAVRYDCLHGEAGKAMSELAALAGDSAVPFYEQVVASCPVAAGDNRPAACGALDALAAVRSPLAQAALRRQAAASDAQLERWLGAQLRLWKLAGDAPAAEVLAALSSAREPEGRAALASLLQGRPRDGATAAAVQAALATEKDRSIHALLTTALLEATKPGECVSLDDGRGESGRCLYRCPGESRVVSVERVEGIECALSFKRQQGY